MTEFRPINRFTDFLLPPSIDDWIPEHHLARFVVEMVDQLDLSALTNSYRGAGSAPFHPAMLLGLLIYGYCTGVMSSRRIERATYFSVEFRYIATNQHPDHDTINAFRKRFLPQIEEHFLRVLTLARDMGVLKVGNVALDGTKLKANASRHSALSYEHACKIEKQLQLEIKELMAAADKADQEPVPEGLVVPEELLRREQRLAAVTKAKQEMEARAKERFEREKAEHEAKLAKRERKERETGKKPGGKPPEAPKEGPRPQDQVNLTDEQSRIMPTRGGSFEQAYNGQAAVDIESMLIVGVGVTQEPNDSRQVKPMLEQLGKLPEELGQVERLIADTGYFSAENVEAIENAGLEPMIAPKREEHHPDWKERFAEPAPLPEGADALTRMKHRLQTQAGKKIYAKRKCTVEPVFGIIKSVMGFRQFLLRGVQQARGEWSLVALAWNLKRLYIYTVNRAASAA
jgi:transposase